MTKKNLTLPPLLPSPMFILSRRVRVSNTTGDVSKDSTHVLMIGP